MALGRKKLDDKILKTLRELVSIGGNKECFDCGQKGPTYINMTIGSFVCTSCSGILRGLTPPHRVKSISMATFTQEEIEFLKRNGNENCSRTWLGLWDAKRTIKQEHRDFMIDKYERKRYYLEPASPLKSLQTNTSSSLSSLTMKNVNENMVPLKTPTLTPPTTLRLHRSNSSSCNGLNNAISSSMSTGSGHGNGPAAQFQQQFTPDDSDFFGVGSPKILPPTPKKLSNLHRKNGIKIKKPVIDLPPTFERNQKNGLLNTSISSNGNSAGEYSGSTGDINANKFTPNSDFVADFGSASIVNNIINDRNHYGSINSLKDSGTAGVENAIGHPHQGKSSDGDVENFADFDHNPIFNSAGLPVPALYNTSSSRSNNNTSVSSAPSVDRYAALKDLDEQFREFKLDADSSNMGTLASNGLKNLDGKSDHHTQFNPFKPVNPFQQQEQQEHRQGMNWPIATANGTTTDLRYPSTASSENGFYATSPFIGLAQGGDVNTYNGNITTGVTGVIPVDYHTLAAYHRNGNGYSVAISNGTMMNSPNNVNSSMQQFVSSMPAQTFGNPFMVTGTGNSNNPFL
ncbi:arf-GAP domain and FG repeat-containing protein 1 isoform X2 [Anopheles aquasalis]|uniref:arf-GAP domain and FG repeat-containing protein 1 isoform X2 n=1 Tax=Anopheles aquasalis TaxID=42839 RepID=UPI00215A85B0|nr:arf-GAP domain and FG repeat-containing protein 1 isoform X2 [Anopheles aquasalis]